MAKNLLDTATDGQKNAILELVSELELNDVENSIENATRCLKEQGHRELEVMASNYYWRAGINHVKNEIREILGLARLETELEKRRREAAIKYPMAGKMDWNCPKLEPHELEITEGSAQLIPVGDDLATLLVIGTKDAKKAVRIMRRYQRDFLDDTDLATVEVLQSKKLVWRSAEYEGEQDSTHMFSWSSRDTKHNPKAVDAFIFEV